MGANTNQNYLETLNIIYNKCISGTKFSGDLILKAMNVDNQLLSHMKKIGIITYEKLPGRTKATYHWLREKPSLAMVDEVVNYRKSAMSKYTPNVVKADNDNEILLLLKSLDHKISVLYNQLTT